MGKLFETFGDNSKSVWEKAIVVETDLFEKYYDFCEKRDLDELYNDLYYTTNSNKQVADELYNWCMNANLGDTYKVPEGKNYWCFEIRCEKHWYRVYEEV